MQECVICCEDIELNTEFTSYCNHNFHHSCITRWCQHNNSCPTCRAPNIMTIQKPIVTDNNNYYYNNNINQYINNIDNYINNVNNISIVINNYINSANYNNNNTNYNNNNTNNNLINNIDREYYINNIINYNDI